MTQETLRTRLLEIRAKAAQISFNIELEKAMRPQNCGARAVTATATSELSAQQAADIERIASELIVSLRDPVPHHLWHGNADKDSYLTPSDFVPRFKTHADVAGTFDEHSDPRAMLAFIRLVFRDPAPPYRSGTNDVGPTTICPACVVADPRLRLCEVHALRDPAPQEPPR